jgi:hypothetical protein
MTAVRKKQHALASSTARKRLIIAASGHFSAAPWGGLSSLSWDPDAAAMDADLVCVTR